MGKELQKSNATVTSSGETPPFMLQFQSWISDTSHISLVVHNSCGIRIYFPYQYITFSTETNNKILPHHYPHV